MTNQQVGRAGELFVAAEIHRRGGYAVTFAGNMPGIDLLASDCENTQRVSIQVKTKGPTSKGWQTSTRLGLDNASAEPVEHEGRFWIFVDLGPEHPEFYVMPELWIRNDIYQKNLAYLERHGGQRPKAPDSQHHLILVPRIVEWKAAWHVLGIFDEANL